jgi:hypothetical protein
LSFLRKAQGADEGPKDEEQKKRKEKNHKQRDERLTWIPNKQF